MNKNILQELVLPSFWLFFFIVSPASDAKVDQLQKTKNIEIKKQDDIPVLETSNTIDKNKEATLIKAVYLFGF